MLSILIPSAVGMLIGLAVVAAVGLLLDQFLG